MLDRTDRLLGLLASRPSWTATDLAAELGVSLRTVRRDLAQLRARGVPVEAERGRGGGIRVPPRVGLGRLLLSQHEIIDLLLALAVAEGLRSPFLASSLRGLRQKITAAFPTEERSRIAALRRRILLGPAASPQVLGGLAEPRAAVVRELQRAFFDQRAVDIAYAGPAGPSRRAVEPHHLLLSWPAWYVVAWDRGRDAPRTFRLDRIEAAVPRPDTFHVRPPETMMTQAGRLFLPL
jgi:predicted DNA-binding transcriptional regulator YafY